MDKKYKKDLFFDILLLNNEAELKKFLLENGKQPKPRCPVTFMSMENLDEINFYGNFAIV